MTVSAHNWRVITNCTNRKLRGSTTISLTKRELTLSPRELARVWVAKIADADKEARVADLYKGRSFSDAKTVSELLDADLYVISAGLGLVKEDKCVPSYDLTVAGGSNSVLPVLRRTGLSSADWWRLLTDSQNCLYPIAHKLFGTRSTLTFIALPSTYLDMVASDLEQLSNAQLSKVRIFTSEAGQQQLSDRFRPICMPYDDRLEGHSEFAGTRADFPQRALRHFVEAIKGQSMSADEAQAAVLASMKCLKKPVLPSRTRKSNEEIVQLLREHWERFNGHRGPLLRYLRDEAQVSCEQSRFGALWREIRSQPATQ